MNTQIDWHLISDFLSYYKVQEYKYIDTPWVVSDTATYVTLPSNFNPTRIGSIEDGRSLVGSAEQGFIEMMLHGELSFGKWVSAGPCFREEVNQDDLRRSYFFKIELCHILTDQQWEYKLDHLADMIHDVEENFEQHINLNITKKITDSGFDLEINGIEIGSYGFRSFSGFNWIYGTGLALPRFDAAINYKK